MARSSSALDELKGPISLVFGGLVAFALGCGLVDTQTKKKEKGDSGQEDRPPLPCEEKDYPCTYGEVDSDVLLNSLQLSGRVMRRSENGRRWKKALEWVRNQPDVVEATGSPTAIRFRLEGGRPVWSTFGLSPIGSGDDSGGSTQPANRTGPGENTRTRHSRLVVGEDRENRERKRALTFTPYWSTSGNTGGAEKDMMQAVNRVSNTLKTTRGYDHPGAISKPAGPPESNPASYLKHFKNWGEEDLVFISTHGTCVNAGGSDCGLVGLSTAIDVFPDDPSHKYYLEKWRERSNGDCERVKLSEEQQRTNDQYRMGETTIEEWKASDLPEKMRARAQAGLEIAGMCVPGSEKEKTVGTSDGYVTTKHCDRKFVYLVTSEFFESFSGNTDDMLVFAHGCESHARGSSGMAAVFGGESSVYMGWSTVVHHTPIVRKFFQRVAADGVTSWSALQGMEKTYVDRTVANPDSTCPPSRDNRSKVARLRHSEQEEILRIREVVELKGPNGQELEDGQNLSRLLDGVAGDGKKDKLDGIAIIEGIEKEGGQTNADDFEFHLELDGEEVGPTINVGKKGKIVSRPGSAQSPNSYDYELELEEIPLERDLDESKRHSLAAVVTLPEGKESRHELEELYINNCWARFSVEGGISWSSRDHEFTEPFGNILAAGEFLISIHPPLKLSAFRFFNLHSDGPPWVGAGPYQSMIAAVSVSEKKAYASPDTPGGGTEYSTLEVEKVFGDEGHKLARGTFKGPVSPSGSDRTVTLEGEFSLPIVRINEAGMNIDTTDPGSGSLVISDGDWKETCGGTHNE